MEVEVKLAVEVEVTICSPGDGGDQDAHGGPDEGRGVAHRRQALRLDEHSHLRGGGEVRRGEEVRGEER